MDEHLLLKRVKSMLTYRGYTKIMKADEGKLIFLHAKDFERPDHPRSDSQVILVIDLNNTYSTDRVQKHLQSLSSDSRKYKISPMSSLMLVFNFKLQQSNQYYINEQSSRLPFYIEVFQHSDFIADLSIPRKTAQWNIVKPKETEIVSGKIIDRPATLISSDTMVRYIGARPGDYIMFKQLFRCEGTAMFVTCVKLVVSPRALDEEGMEDFDED